MRVDEIYFRVGNGEGNWKGREFYKEKRRFVSVIPLFTFSTENVTFASLSLLFFFPLSFLDHPPSVSRFIFSDQNTGRSWGGEERGPCRFLKI